MSGYAFDYLCGTVTVPAAAPDAWEREGLSTFYQEPGDPRWSGALSQVLFHESAHYWQFLASGYLANLVADEWQRLNDFESTGAMPEKGGNLENHTRVVEGAPFSAYQLVECWVRFWEYHTRGAEALADEDGIQLSDASPEAYFDWVMRHGYDARLYAAPYQWMADQADGDEAFIGLAFPIIAHHAFGTLDPVSVFCESFVRARQSRAVASLIAEQRSGDVAWNCIQAWHGVFSESVLPVSMERALPPFMSGMEVIERGPLRTHPIFREFAEVMDGLQSFLKNPSVDVLAEAGLPEAREALNQALDMARHDPWIVFALPGLSVYRRLLGIYMPPPKVVFNNFDYYMRRPSTIRHREVQAGSSNVAETYADRSMDLERRIRRFRAAEKAVALGLPANAFETPEALAEGV